MNGKFLFASAFLLSLFILPVSALGCEPGAQECVSSSSYRNCSEFAIWGEETACPASTECSNGICEPKLGCQPGTKECIDSSSYHTCGNYGIWNTAVSCESYQTCQNGACTPQPQCGKFQETRCSPSDYHEIQICNAAYQWENFKYCDVGCQNGFCLACRQGNTRCIDSYTYQTCDSDGQWGGSTRCPADDICSDGVCTVSPLVACQQTGATRCSPSNTNVLQQCGSNHRWADFSYCQLGCKGGACKACSLGDSKCTDSFSYVKCTSDYQWGGRTSCPDGYYCYAGSCQTSPDTRCSSKGDKRCSPSNPSMLQMCNDNFVYADYLSCPDGCVNGVCAECKPGTSVCSGAASFRTCTVNGQLSSPQQCAAGYACDHGACVAAPECTEGARNCVSDSIYECTGGKWSLLMHCPSDTDCRESTGTAYCAEEARNNTAPAPQPQPAPAPQPQITTTWSAEPILIAITLVSACVAVYIWSTRKR